MLAVEITVHCDRVLEDGFTCTASLALWAQTKTAAYEELKKKGWKQGAERDFHYCPTHTVSPVNERRMRSANAL